MVANWPPKKSFVEHHSLRESIARLSWRAALGAILLGVVGNAVFAVIGLLPQYRNEIEAFLVKTPLFWIVVYATLIGFFVLLLRHNKRRWTRIYMESHLFLNSLDDSLLRLLPALITTDKHGPGSHEQELETRMERIVNSSMEKANNMVFRGRAQKGLLFCLDDAGEQLVIRHKYGWVTDIQGFRRLAPGVFEGVVGEVYRKGEIIVAHRREANGQYRWDRDTYVPRGGNEGPPPYNAIVCVPIIGTSHSSTEDNRLGVLCFDSADVDLFDPPEIKETLEKFARHLATSLQIYSKLSQACSASSCIYVRARPVA